MLQAFSTASERMKEVHASFMNKNMKTALHELAQQQIIEACNRMGIQVQMEYAGEDWRADVLAFAENKRYAFEIQITQQSLKKTQERQEKYIRDGIIGCWLFEKEPARQREELEHLPIFRLIQENDSLSVSLKGRKTLPLETFIKDFITDKIKFCHTLKPLPRVNVVFVEMPCYKCGVINHFFYLAPFTSACNTKIRHDEAMWTNKKFSFHPEILKKVKEYASTEQGKYLNLATIKERYSSIVGESYMSFGCSCCDSIFGDFYIHDAIVDAWYGDGVVGKLSFDLDFDLGIHIELPHWCHPGDNPFCE